ncbi:hypothetical protein D3C87_1347670 [compost metagenome]
MRCIHSFLVSGKGLEHLIELGTQVSQVCGHAAHDLFLSLANTSLDLLYKAGQAFGHLLLTSLTLGKQFL